MGLKFNQYETRYVKICTPWCCKDDYIDKDERDGNVETKLQTEFWLESLKILVGSLSYVEG
jgi:hypothetical protein